MPSIRWYKSTRKTDSVAWQNYGTESGNPKCANCMVHSGYEASSMDDAFGSLKGFWAMIRANFSKYPDPEALARLEEPAPEGLVQLGPAREQADEVHV